MTDIIQELRGLIAKGVPESDSGWYISSTTGSGLSIIEDGLMFPGSGICPIKCEPPQAALIVAAINHLPALLDRLEAAERGWQPIETMKLWEVGVVTDGQQACVSQKAQGDFDEVDEHYFAVDPEDAIEWQPTHWRPLPDAPAIREVKP